MKIKPRGRLIDELFNSLPIQAEKCIMLYFIAKPKLLE